MNRFNYLTLLVSSIFAFICLGFARMEAADGAWSNPQADPKAKPLTQSLSIKVLNIAMFEVGSIMGDEPGEAQLWVERKKMTERYLIPGAFSPLYCNRERHCLMVAGMGTANATASLLALGLHPKIDLR